MDHWLLAAATAFALIGGISGMRSVHLGRRSPWTLVWMLGCLLWQIAFLAHRGQERMACPLGDRGEFLAFLAWSLTVFYVLVGPTYRISLLGVFTAPLVVALQGIALIPGVLTEKPTPLPGGNAWHETHSATSVLAMGALALAAVAGVMFLTLNHQLKERHLKSGLFRNLPPVRELLTSLTRLLWLGLTLLTVGIVAGFMMPDHAEAMPHLIAALAMWGAYLSLLLTKTYRGMTGRSLSLACIGLFLSSLSVFALL